MQLPIQPTNFPINDKVKTPPCTHPSTFDASNIQHAIVQAQLGQREGGIPIGAALVTSEGAVIGVGRNRRVQEDSAIKHGEIDCLNNIGRLPASVYKGCTFFTTLSPCPMCSGAMVLFGIKRIVIGENDTIVSGEGILKDSGIEIINLDLQECKDMMEDFIEKHPDIWNEDIGEE